MKINDFGTISKIGYLLQSLATPLQLRKLRNVEIDNEAKPHEQHLAVVANLCKFDSPKCLFDWKPCSDRLIGGDSAAEVEYHPQEKYMSLRGQIVAKNKDKLESAPYIGMEMLPWLRYRVRLHHFNVIRMRVRTDGGLVRWLFHMASRTGTDKRCTGVIVDKSREWQTLELPFANLETNDDDGHDQSMYALADLPTLSSIGLKISSQESRQVKLDISSIDVVFNPAVNQFLSQYRRPIFYRQLRSYVNVQQIDNGREKLVRG